MAICMQIGIPTYFIDPEGDFVEALGRQHSPQAAAELITGHIKDWKKPMKDDVELYATPAAGVVTTGEHAPAPAK